MKKFKTWLSGLLAVQLILVIALFMHGQSGAEFDQEKALVSVELDKVDKIEIYQSADKRLDVIKDNAVWRLPDYGDLPATTKRVDEILDKISAAKTGWPVVSSSSGQKRFEVSDDNYQRKIVLYKEAEPVETFYLGTSPGYRSVHLRREGEGDVFSVKLAAHDFPLDAVDWFDTMILKVDEVLELRFTDFGIQKTDDIWQLAGASVAQTPQPLDQEAVADLVSLFNSLNVEALAQDVTLSSPVTVSVSAKQGDYVFTFGSAEDNYYVSRGDIDKVFRIAKSDFETLNSANLAALIETPSQDEKTELGSEIENGGSAQTVMDSALDLDASGS